MAAQQNDHQGSSGSINASATVVAMLSAQLYHSSITIVAAAAIVAMLLELHRSGRVVVVSLVAVEVILCLDATKDRYKNKYI